LRVLRAQVRNAALHVWKSIVLNTPRTLGEILPLLMQRIIGALAASGADQRTSASRCLGELVRKLAERVLPTIVPILQKGLSDPDSNTRQVRLLHRRGAHAPAFADAPPRAGMCCSAGRVSWPV
jgi:hypothetical protein